MVAKKKTDEVTEEQVAPEPAPKPKEKLIAVTALVWFSDGNLKDFMAQYGYPCEWLAGETRSLPTWLIQRCINSGAELEQA
jgi:hypothetical protein